MCVPARGGLVPLPLAEASFLLLGGCDNGVMASGTIPVVVLSWDDCDGSAARSVADGTFCFCPSTDMGGEGDV